jgi:hypothetical protein
VITYLAATLAAALTYRQLGAACADTNAAPSRALEVNRTVLASIADEKNQKSVGEVEQVQTIKRDDENSARWGGGGDCLCIRVECVADQNKVSCESGV